jgi:hypothetical protein
MAALGRSCALALQGCHWHRTTGTTGTTHWHRWRPAAHNEHPPIPSPSLPPSSSGLLHPVRFLASSLPRSLTLSLSSLCPSAAFCILTCSCCLDQLLPPPNSTERASIVASSPSRARTPTPTKSNARARPAALSRTPRPRTFVNISNLHHHCPVFDPYPPLARSLRSVIP